ncbi:MAG: hypothetical protein KDK76_05180 [Chlamydiia bacterium]|nr:hypothetical protein [Chlamydiia bacterium]
MLKTALSFSSEKAWDIEWETLSVSQVLNEPPLSKLNDIDRKFHKTFLYLKTFPEDSDYVLKLKRPIFKEEEITEEISIGQFMLTAKLLGKKYPSHVILSQGFLPGEIVQVWFETKKGKEKSPIFEIQPHPNVEEIPGSSIKLAAELVSPLYYFINFEGFEENEILEITSFSWDERLNNEIKYQKKMGLGFSPAVIDKDRGIARLKVKRKKGGDSLTLVLPWGQSLMQYLTEEGRPIQEKFTPIKGDIQG